MQDSLLPGGGGECAARAISWLCVVVCSGFTLRMFEGVQEDKAHGPAWSALIESFLRVFPAFSDTVAA